MNRVCSLFFCQIVDIDVKHSSETVFKNFFFHFMISNLLLNSPLIHVGKIGSSLVHTRTSAKPNEHKTDQGRNMNKKLQPLSI